MNALDRDALDGLWPAVSHSPPSRDAIRGVASVRLFGEDGDEYTEEVTVTEHGEVAPGARASASAPPPIELTLPEPPLPLAGGIHGSRTLFNGLLAGVLLGGLVLWLGSRDEPEEVTAAVIDEAQEAPVELPEATVPSTEDVDALEEVELEPAVAILEEVPQADPEADPIGAIIGERLEQEAEIATEEATSAGEVEEESSGEAAVPTPEVTAPAKANRPAPPPARRMQVDFPGTFAANGHLATFQDADAWSDLVKALQASKGPISLVGHTDIEHSSDIGMKRAKSVRALLVKKGLDMDRIAVLSAGTLRPASSNPAPEGRSKNRRVQVLYTSAQTD